MYILDQSDNTIHTKTVELTEDLFPRIRETFGRGFPETISVLSEKSLAFNVIWEEEFYHCGDGSGVRQYEVNYHGEELAGEADLLDLTFLRGCPELCFDSVNEYSWQITRLVNRLFPEKPVWFEDPCIRFFPELTCGFREKTSGNESPVFYSGHRPPESERDCSVYSLMISLTWAKKRHFNKNYLHDGTLLIIDFQNPFAGFGDLIRIAYAFLEIAASRGWTPKICLDHGSQYADTPGEDAWKKFFSQPGCPKDPDPDHYRCWISVFENRSYCGMNYINPYIGMLGRNLTPDTRFFFNQKTASYADRKLPAVMKTCADILGVVVRATDLDAPRQAATNCRDLISAVRRFFRNGEFEYLFLATEDAQILRLFQEEFGSKLLWVEQQRVEYRGGEDGRLLESLMSRRYSSNFEKGADYLSAIYALAGCRSVIYNRFCGAVYLSRICGSSFRQTQTPDRPGFFQMANIRDGSQIAERPSSDRYFVYGAGERAENLIPFLKACGKKVILCDRKAENGEYVFHGCRVVSVSTLKEMWRGEEVLITPWRQRETIRRTLREAGIAESSLIAGAEESDVGGFTEKRPSAFTAGRI